MSGQLLDKSIGRRGRSQVGTWPWFSISKADARRGSNEPEGTVRHEEDDDDDDVDGMGWDGRKLPFHKNTRIYI